MLCEQTQRNVQNGRPSIKNEQALHGKNGRTVRGAGPRCAHAYELPVSVVVVVVVVVACCRRRADRSSARRAD